MTSTRRSFLLLPIAAALSRPLAARAEEAPARIAGVSFDRRIRLGGSELLLNGVGVRAEAWFKGYAAGLYLPAHAASAAAAVAMPGPKRLQMRMLHEVPAGEFVKAIRKGMTRNIEAKALPRLEERIERFATLVEAVVKVHEGDLINLDFEPARGMLFSLNGTLRGEAIAGEDFYGALLRAFIGDHPYDEKLKAGLLGSGA